MSILPKLNPKQDRPMDWQLRKIMAASPEAVTPPAWKNPVVKETAPRDQDFRGTCVGQGTAYLFDGLHLMLCPQDMPTAADKAQFKKNVVDAVGTTHDVLYPQSASAEHFYAMSRDIGNVDYPEGSETRFAARAWIKYGMIPETTWHTDKKGTLVWTYPPGPRVAANGGISQDQAFKTALQHVAEGWAMLGDSTGNGVTWSEITTAIYKYGFVLAGIPVYENYGQMAGGDGSFPEPSGDIAGYHCLCFYGYDEGHLYLQHSWGDWCGRFGSISKHYFQTTTDSSVYLVIMDSKDVAIARQIFSSLQINVRAKDTKEPLPAMLTINGKPIGNAPQKITVEPNTKYTIEVGVMPGYNAMKTEYQNLGETETTINLDLEPVPVPQKGIWERIVEYLKRLLNWK